MYSKLECHDIQKDSKISYEYIITDKPVMYFTVSGQARPWGAPQSPGLWGKPHDGQLQARPPCTDQLPSQGLPRKGNKKINK